METSCTKLKLKTINALWQTEKIAKDMKACMEIYTKTTLKYLNARFLLNS